jgi:hypothetical protein
MSMGRPSSWVFWLACAYVLAAALLGFWVAMSSADTGGLLWGVGLLMFVALMGLVLAFYALRSLHSLRQPPPPGEGPDAAGP